MVPSGQEYNSLSMGYNCIFFLAVCIFDTVFMVLSNKSPYQGNNGRLCGYLDCHHYIGGVGMCCFSIFTMCSSVHILNDFKPFECTKMWKKTQFWTCGMRRAHSYTHIHTQRELRRCTWTQNAVLFRIYLCLNGDVQKIVKMHKNIDYPHKHSL